MTMKMLRAIFCLTAFTLGLHAQAQDVGSYSIQKEVNYDQSSASTPTLDPVSPYQFFSNINPGTSGASFTAATALTPPTGSTGLVYYMTGEMNGAFGSTNANGLYFSENFTSKAALDAAFPSGTGTYNFAVKTTTPNSYTDQMSFGSDNYGAIPQITNVTNATWVGGYLVVTDITKPVVFTWNTPNAFFYMWNGNYNSGSYPGTSTTFTLPANSLTNNTYNVASIIISNTNGAGYTNSNTITSAYGEASFTSQNTFIIQAGTPTGLQTMYTVEKIHFLLQTGNGAPVNATGDNNDYYSGGDYAPYSLWIIGHQSGSIAGPQSTSFPLAPETDNGNKNQGDFEYLSGSMSSQAALDAAYPDGSYTFPGGTTVSLTGDGYPTAPQILTVNGATPVWNAQGQLVLNPAVQNIISWSTVTVPNFATAGYEEASFYTGHGSFNNPIDLTAGVLTSSTTPFTSMTVPANTMTTGNTYNGYIDYVAGSTFTNPSTNVYDVAAYKTGTYFYAIAGSLTAVSQAITFPAPANQNVGAQFTLNATSTSGLPVTYSLTTGSTSLATLSGPNNSIVTVTGVGKVVILAKQAGNSTYAAATTVVQSFQVGAQTITFPSLNTQQVVGVPVELEATASSGLPITYVITGPATLSGTTLTLTGTGTVTVQATQPGNTNFSAATPVTQTLNVVTSSVGGLVIMKQISYAQSSASTVTLSPETPYQFSSSINPGMSGALAASATLTPPAGATGTVSYMDSVASGLNFQENFASQAAMDAAFPSGPGTYNLMIQTATPSTYTYQLSFGPDAYPPTPQLTGVTYGPSNTPASWAGGNLVIPDNTQTITFTFSNPGGAYNASFSIWNTNFSSWSYPSYATSTTFTLPANSLSNNTSYPVAIYLSNNGTSAEFSKQLLFNLQIGTPSTSSSPTLYLIEKKHVLAQTANSAPVGDTGDSNDWNDDDAPYSLSIQCPASGTVTGPGSISFPLTFDRGENNNSQRYFSGSLTSLSLLNSTCPNGTYTFPGGTQITFSATDAGFPSAAQILTVNGATPAWNAQGQLELDPTIQNIIAWSSVTVPNFATNGHEDVDFYSFDGIFNEINPTSGVVTSTTTPFTTLTIPANAMSAGTSYRGQITYMSSPSFSEASLNVYEGALYDTVTEFYAIANYAPLPPSITSINTAAFTVGQSSSFTVTATGSPAPAFSWAATSGTLPAGLSLSSATGVISGTPTVTGTYPITITASNGVGSNATQSFTLTVLPLETPPVITSAASATVAAGQTSYFVVTATGTPVPTFGATGLPMWASLNSTSGILTLTPPTNTVGQSAITFTASNGNLPDATQVFTLNVQLAQTFPQWASNNSVSNSPTATPLNDSAPDLLKFLYNINPAQPMTTEDRAALPVVGMTTTPNAGVNTSQVALASVKTMTTGGTQYLTLTYRQNALASGVTPTPQASTDLQTWQAVTPVQIGNDPTTGDPIMQAQVPISGATQFLRLNVTNP